jgi:hypothetical protein
MEGGICVVDECMKYSEEECVKDGFVNCAVVAVGGGRRCVNKDCSGLNAMNCNINEEKCKVVNEVCLSNPCVNSECESPACKKIAGEKGDEDVCVYDECAQYSSAGMKITFETIKQKSFFFSCV